MPGSPAHLLSRFLDVATARRLTAFEKATVEIWLTPDTAEIFFAQDHPDQRHGYHAAVSVMAAGVSDRDVLMAALLHDVGKRHAGLGIIGRSIASVLILAGLPLSRRMETYRDHGLVAARELGALSVPSLVVDFAMHHHGDRPPTIAPEVWDVLIVSDQAPKPGSSVMARITSPHR